MSARLVSPLEAACAHVTVTHGGDVRRAIMRANRRDQRPEPLPRDLVQQQGWKAWIMATANDEGVVVVDSEGEQELVSWYDIAKEQRRGAPSD